MAEITMKLLCSSVGVSGSPSVWMLAPLLKIGHRLAHSNPSSQSSSQPSRSPPKPHDRKPESPKFRRPPRTSPRRRHSATFNLRGCESPDFHQPIRCCQRFRRNLLPFLYHRSKAWLSASLLVGRRQEKSALKSVLLSGS